MTIHVYGMRTSLVTMISFTESKMSNSEKQIPVRKDLWRIPDEVEGNARLIGSKCLRCGELFFPKKDNGICTYCQSEELEEILLSTRGKVYSYTVVMQRPPVYYKGEVPYAIGFVELPEGIRIETLFSGCDFESLKTGMDMEMAIEPLGKNEKDEDILVYSFRPVSA